MKKRRFTVYTVSGYEPPKKKKLKMPDISQDSEELLRLMKRKRVEQKFESEEGYGCPICGHPVHLQSECPCNDKIPPGTAISSSFDQVCIGCGRIGEICCNKGAYAVLRECVPCFGIGHWYWDRVCTGHSYFGKLPSIEELEERVKNNDGKFEGVDRYWSSDDDDDKKEEEEEEEEEEYQYGPRDQKKLKMPNVSEDSEELLRLMKRKRVEQKFESEEGYGCPICGDPVHLQSECPCNDKIPPGTAISSEFDEVCIGCGRIGEICCNKGAYAVLRECGSCNGIGHWYWDKVCTPRHSFSGKLPSIEELEDQVKNKEADQSIENYLQNMVEDVFIFMVRSMEDNKDKDVVVDKDGVGKEDETKGGNENSYRRRKRKRELRWGRKQKRIRRSNVNKNPDDGIFTKPTSPYEIGYNVRKSSGDWCHDYL